MQAQVIGVGQQTTVREALILILFGSHKLLGGGK